MSDEHRQNGHLHRLPGHENDEAELLPLELEPIHEQLLRDSDGWSRRLPEADALAGYARAVPIGATVLAPARTLAREDGGEDTGTIATLSPTVQHELSTGGHRQPRGPGRTLLGLAAAVAIVALLAAVFASMAPGRSPAAGKPTASTQPTSTAIPTATPRPAYGPIRGSWQQAPYLRNQPGTPTVAPSDPSVVYEAVFTQTTAPEPVGQYSTLRRSDNGGKTWHTLSVPKPGDSAVTAWGPTGVLISPADPNTIIASIGSQMSYTVPAGCPSDLQTAYTSPSQHGGILASNIQADGFVRCSVQDVSRDGGNTWTPISVAGVHSLPTNGLDALYAQGDRYYATFDAGEQPTDIGSYRVVTSTDGAHWSLVDGAPLAAAKGYRICGFIAVPTGSTIYEKTNDRSCSAYNGPADHLLRSDDAGLHWRDLGPLPYHFTGFIAAEQGSADAQPTLYLWTANTVGQTISGLTDQLVRYSTDGYYWRAAPSKGIPTGYEPYSQVSGTLSDGSVVMMYVSSASAGQHDPVTLGFYAWHAGDSEWHQVTPPLTIADRTNLSGGRNTFFATAGQGVHGTIWHVQFDPTARTYSVETYRS